MSVLISFSIPFIFPKNMFNEPLKMGRDGHAWQWGHVSGVVEMKGRTHSVNVFFQKKKKILSTYYAPGIALDSGDTARRKPDVVPTSWP